MGPTHFPSPQELVENLDADAIRDRLAAIAQERRALLVLLRAALAAKRSGRRKKSSEEDVPNAR